MGVAIKTGPVRQTVSKHLGVLIGVGLLEAIPETHTQRYRLRESTATNELFECNSAIDAVEG